MRIPKLLFKLKKTWFWRRRGLIACITPLVSALVVYFGYTLYNHGAKREFEAFMAQWNQYPQSTQASTTPPTQEEIEAHLFSHPAFLAEKNKLHPDPLNSPAAGKYKGFSNNAHPVSNNDRAGTYQMGVTTDLSLWFDPPIKAPQKELAKHGLHLLKPYQARETALREALSQSAQFPPLKNPATEASKSFEYSSVLIKTSKYYGTKATLNIHANNPSQALSDTATLFHIARSLEANDTLIGFLIYRAILHQTIPVIWEGLSTRVWNESQLAQLKNLLEGIDTRPQFIHSMRGEVAFTTDILQKLIDNPHYLDEQLAFLQISLGFFGSSSPWQDTAIKYASKAIPHGWYIYQYTDLLQTLDKILLHPQGKPNHHLDMSHYHALKAQEDALMDNMLHNKSLFTMYSRQVAQALHNQALIDNMRIAIALERYRLVHGQYPETLAPLSPSLLTTIPTDVVNGQPLQYRLKKDGSPLIYSIGVNNKDDGGIPHRDPELADWPWMYSPPRGFTYQDFRSSNSN